MIQASHMRAGMCILFEGDVCRLMEVKHVTPGNLRGFVQARMRSLKSGNSFDHRFSSTERVERAILETHPMEYLYGYSVVGVLRPVTRYALVAVGLGCLGALVRAPGELRPALERAFSAGRPALVNVLTDPSVIYPRTANLA